MLSWPRKQRVFQDVTHEISIYLEYQTIGLADSTRGKAAVQSIVVSIERSVDILFTLMDLLLVLLPYRVASCFTTLLGLTSMGFGISNRISGPLSPGH